MALFDDLSKKAAKLTEKTIEKSSEISGCRENESEYKKCSG